MPHTDDSERSLSKQRHITVPYRSVWVVCRSKYEGWDRGSDDCFLKGVPMVDVIILGFM